MAGLAEASIPCGQTLSALLGPQATLSIDSISAGIEIVGVDQDTVRVTCSADDMESARRVHLQLNGTPANAKLTVAGPHSPHGNFTVRIEVPRRTNLGLEMAAGDVKVSEVIGDKDLRLRAGAITVSSPRSSSYRDVDASVRLGEVDVAPSGESHGGFFPHVRRTDPNGRYRLLAHVTTGRIVLREMSAAEAVQSE